MSTRTPDVLPHKQARKSSRKSVRPAANDLDIQSPRPAVAGSVVRRGIAAGISAVLRQFDVDPDEYIKLTQMTSATSQDRGHFVQGLALGRLMTLCVKRTNCPHFGLLVGQEDMLSSLGLVGCLMPPRQTVGKALQTLAWHLRQHSLNAPPLLSLSGGMATLRCVAHDPGIEGADQIADGAIATALNIMRALCGPEWVPTEVLLPRPPPSDLGPFQSLCRAPVRFDAGIAALIFPMFWLRQPIAAADEVLRLLFEERLDLSEVIPYDGTFSNGLRHMLRTRLLKEDCSAKRIAGLLSINRRTLNRRLHGEGTSFTIVVNEVRFEIARHLLADTQVTFNQVAAALGFSEPSAFTRAFRRWSGQSPTAWRAEHNPA